MHAWADHCSGNSPSLGCHSVYHLGEGSHVPTNSREETHPERASHVKDMSRAIRKGSGAQSRHSRYVHRASGTSTSHRGLESGTDQLVASVNCHATYACALSWPTESTHAAVRHPSAGARTEACCTSDNERDHSHRMPAHAAGKQPSTFVLSCGGVRAYARIQEFFTDQISNSKNKHRSLPANIQTLYQGNNYGSRSEYRGRRHRRRWGEGPGNVRSRWVGDASADSTTPSALCTGRCIARRSCVAGGHQATPARTSR